MKPKTIEQTLQEILERFDNLEEKVGSRFDEVDGYLKDQGDFIQDFTEKLDTCMVKIEKFAEKSKKTAEEVRKQDRKLGQHDLYLAELTEKIELLEREKRKKTLIIEGVEENPRENLREITDQLFRDLMLSFDSGAIDTIYRRGRVQLPKGGKEAPRAPRAIAVTFVRDGRKGEFYRNIKQLKDLQRWQKVFFGDDLTEKQRKEVKELRAIAAHAKSQGHVAAARGSLLTVDGNKYNHGDLHRLPKDLSLEAAKQVRFDQDKGVAFQGEASKLSNMSKCWVPLDGIDFGSAEEAYQYKRAKVCEAKKEADVIALVNDAYRAKDIGKRVLTTPEWDKIQEESMLKILRIKFNNNEAHRQELLATGERELVEFTSDKKWGCGTTLAKVSQVKVDKLQGQNNLGKLLKQVRNELNGK